MRRLLLAALLAALALSGCGLLYDWEALEPSWMGGDAGTDGGFSVPDAGGFPWAQAPGGAARARPL